MAANSIFVWFAAFRCIYLISIVWIGASDTFVGVTVICRSYASYVYNDIRIVPVRITLCVHMVSKFQPKKRTNIWPIDVINPAHNFMTLDEPANERKREETPVKRAFDAL